MKHLVYIGGAGSGCRDLVSHLRETPALFRTYGLTIFPQVFNISPNSGLSAIKNEIMSVIEPYLLSTAQFLLSLYLNFIGRRQIKHTHV